MADWFEKVPLIKTQLPGPRAKKIIKQDEQYTSTSYTRIYPLVVKEGRGCGLLDVDENVFLDFAAGIAVCTTGHCHPRVVRAIERQSEKLLHICTADFYFPEAAELAEKLCKLAPGHSQKRVFFCNSGTEANEAAIKLVRYTTKRQTIISFLGGFHGRTIGAMSLTGSKTQQRAGFGPLMPAVIHVPFPDPYHPPFNTTSQDLVGECLQYIEDVIFQKVVIPQEVAAIFVEPIQGEGGYIVPPNDFLKRLKNMVQKYGILLVVDEVQSGMGRTGKMFGCEHFDVEPDILCISKGIASGLPLGVMVARKEIMTWHPGSHANTLGGNPISCAAALETIRLLEEGLMGNAAQMGDVLFAKLKHLKERYPFCGEVRGKGLMIGMEIIKDSETRIGDTKRRDSILQACFQKGLVLLGCGKSAIRFCPPLIVKRNEIDQAVTIIEEVFQSLLVE